MSAALEQTGSHDVATPTTERIDGRDKYVYDIPESDLRIIYCFLDHNDVWKKVADQMGYSINDCIVSFYFISILVHGMFKFMFKFITFFTAIQAIC